MDKLLDENLIQIDYLRLLFGTIILLIEIIFIQYLYLKFSNSYNNKIKFSKNFIPFGISILIIVTVIKSSLALSLGLIGALSIIRFRTAIKEPEEIIMLLLIMGGAVSIAAEKELLSVMLISIFGICYYFLNKKVGNNFSSHDVIIRFPDGLEKESNLLSDQFNKYLTQFSKNNNGEIVVYYKFHSQDMVIKIFDNYENYNCDFETMTNEE